MGKGGSYSNFIVARMYLKFTLECVLTQRTTDRVL